MAVRTVRLDAETERLLAELCKETGLSVSGALKRGLSALRDALHANAAVDPWSVYSSLDLGPAHPRKHDRARNAKAELRASLARKHRR